MHPLTDERKQHIFERLKALQIKPFLPFDGLMYKYVSYKTAEIILKNSTMRFTPPAKFNDPFDLTPQLIDFTASNAKLKKWLASSDQRDSKWRKKLLRNIKNDPAKLINAMRDGLTKYKDKFGICCFSKSPHKTLMWSHYANSHEGVCLGFSWSPQMYDNMLLYIMTVSYEDQINPLNYFTDQELALFKWVFTKSSVWEYEEEVRALFIEFNGDAQFPKSSLIELYFGLRLTVEQKNRIKTLLKSHNYSSVEKISEMTMDAGTFNLKERMLTLDK